MNTYIPLKKEKKTVKAEKICAGRDKATPFFMLCLMFFVFLLAFPDIARKAVLHALEICASTLIPVLFPFMVISDIMLYLGLDKVSGRIFGKPFKKIFGISENGTSAFILGCVCGLPLGGKYAVSLYKNGKISKNECERLIGISSNAGLGFVVIGVGKGIWGSSLFGVAVYLCQIVAAIICGALLFRPKNHVSIAPVAADFENKPFSAIITDAVCTSAVAMLKVCGFVIFFASVSAFLSELCRLFYLPPLFFATLSAFTEISFSCVTLHDFFLSGSVAGVNCAKLLTFFAVGYAGFSAHLQLASFAIDSDVSMRKYHLMKLLQGVVCAFMGAIVLRFIPF